MPLYKNGYIPVDLLVSVGSGEDSYGRYDWLLSPSTAAKHEALLKRNPRLRPSAGFSCYRPYAWQVKYRAVWGNGAAWAGTSSHGGLWEGKQTLAIDYGNWAYCYGNRDGRDTPDKRDAFFADCRAVGLSPNLICPARGYPDEPWHVIDLDPWAPTTAGTVTGLVPEAKKARAGMATVYVNVDTKVFALAGDGVGKAAWLEFTDQQLANNLVAFHGISQKAVPLGDVSFREWRAKYLGAS
ncbi:hypothetical protein ACSBPH_01530 [Microbacterium sp. F51-2R]|uniref:hypothetical protein n=1 Tax=Microbacterium sp. F51-2R TaxID=3445777 RepID=UPI003FA149CB